MTKLYSRVSALLVLFSLGLLAWAEEPQAGRSGYAGGKGDIVASWDRLLTDVIPQAPADPVLKVQQVPFVRGPANDFENHFFMESRTEYLRQDYFFTGLPTTAGVINVPRTDIFNPLGIPFTSAFQPSANSIYEFLNWGTTGWLSPRVNSNFSFRYRQDLTHLEPGSPGRTVLNTFGADRRLELLTGSIEIKGMPTDGAFAGTSLTLGRQHVYGAQIASFDGGSFSINRSKYYLTLFGGRRYSYFADPDQRAIGGGNITFKLAHGTDVEYQVLAYIKTSQRISLRKHFEPHWFVDSYLSLVGGKAVDFNANVLFLPTGGKTTIRAGFFQKLTNNDFFYDYTFGARNLDRVFNRLRGLNLGPISEYSQFLIDARRQISSRLRLGGAIIVRRLNDSADQGPFNDSFEDYRINAQIYPVPSLETFFEFRQHNTDRATPLGHIRFDEVSIAGETRTQDWRAEVRRGFGKGRLVLNAGGFYRRLDLQDRFFYIYNANTKGVLGGAQVKIDSHTRAYFQYGLDTDYFVFRPSLDKAQNIRLGLVWKY